ncbi:MAG: hypothetical protein ABSH20_20125, partial [Tepidisphaeraceae bacterium]
MAQMGGIALKQGFMMSLRMCDGLAIITAKWNVESGKWRRRMECKVQNAKWRRGEGLIGGEWRRSG